MSFGPPQQSTPPYQPPYPPMGPPPQNFGVPVRQPPPPPPAPKPKSRLGLVVATAAMTSALVGGAAGVGGVYLGSATAQPKTRPTSVAPPAVPRPPVAGAPANADIPMVAERMLPSTVTIYARSGTGRSTGSGFILDGSGHIMTNNHVVEDVAAGGQLQVEFHDGARKPATLVGRSPGYDIAVIRVDPLPNLVPVDIGDSAATKPGQTAIALGAPLGLGGSVTAGIVSAVDRPLQVSGTGSSANDGDAKAYINGIQTDAPINVGNSGGPLVDAGGRVIGVNSAILTVGTSQTGDRQGGNIGVGFAIPINQAKDIGDQLIRSGKAQYPVIGAEVSDADDGVKISRVITAGPAEKAGLRAGDVVKSINGHPVFESTDLIVRVRTYKPRTEITLGVDGRGDIRVTLDGKDG